MDCNEKKINTNELNDDALEQVTGGNAGSAADTDFKTQFKMDESEKQYEYNLYTDGTKESAMEKFFNK